MRIQDRILADLKRAMKNGDKTLRSVTKMLLSEIKYAQMSMYSKKDLDERTAINIVNNYYKRLKKAYVDLPDGGERRELLRQELEIVRQYLPTGHDLEAFVLQPAAVELY